MRGAAPGPASPLRLSLPGEQRGAALVALLQPLCQLHHREHHQSPEPQSHGHRGHVRCGGLLEAEGWAGARDTGVLPNVDSWVHTVSLSPNPQAPPPVPTPLPQSLWWPPLEQPLGQHHLRLCPSQNQEEGDTVGGDLACSPSSACDLGRDLASWGSVSLVFPGGHQVMAKVPPGAPSIRRSPRFPSFLLGAFLTPPWKESTPPLPPPASTPEGRRGARGAPHCPADPSPPRSQTPT